jgi:predicted SAM-dependent methyltransferase
MNSTVDKDHQLERERFENIWDKGDYRLGSTAQRLIPRIIGHVKGGVINDYGSGTGRAEVELLKSGYRVNMVDIAPNALEADAKALLAGGKLTFTEAPLWSLPLDFPHAPWGLCINTLMVTPPEKLAAILGEIRRTCDNLFFEAYDLSDIRMGSEQTKTKGDAAFWRAELLRYWPEVMQEKSPESARRYIFICQGRRTAGALPPGTINDLQGKYAGQTAWIVGRGPSLLKTTAEHFGPGPVIILNEAVINIASLGLPNDIYNIWRNGDVLPDLPKYGIPLLLCDDPVKPDPPSSTRFLDYAQRFTFACGRDLGCPPPATFSMKAALEIAVRIFGCTAVHFVAFDTVTSGDSRTILGQEFVKSEHRPGAYDEQGQIIKNRLTELNISSEWITPQGAGDQTRMVARTSHLARAGVRNMPAIPLRLNLGCGEILEPGYINIDLHYPQADVQMDVRRLEYADNSVEEITSSHLLEHFGKREIPAILKDWHRVLKPGGILKLNLPNLEWCCKNWLAQPPEKKTGLALDMLFGLQSSEGEYHKTGFTKPVLRALLEQAGFDDIKIGDHFSHEQDCFAVRALKKPAVMTVTVITPTGDRPECISMLRNWMSNQTRQPDQWIIVDDGQAPMTMTGNVQYLRREPQPDDPPHTLGINLKAVLPHVTGTVILIMEDDEYYAPEYIATMAAKLENYEVVGIGRSKYYHLPRGQFIRHMNMDHASLAQTGFRRSFLPEFAALLNGNPWIDIEIWKKIGGIKGIRPVAEPGNLSGEKVINDRGYLFDDGDTDCLYVGMKGLPGRAGIGVGHRNAGEYVPDTPDHTILRQWCRDAEVYLTLQKNILKEF